MLKELGTLLVTSPANLMLVPAIFAAPLIHSALAKIVHTTILKSGIAESRKSVPFLKIRHKLSQTKAGLLNHDMIKIYYPNTKATAKQILG